MFKIVQYNRDYTITEFAVSKVYCTKDKGLFSKEVRTLYSYIFTLEINSMRTIIITQAVFDMIMCLPHLNPLESTSVRRFGRDSVINGCIMRPGFLIPAGPSTWVWATPSGMSVAKLEKNWKQQPRRILSLVYTYT